MASTEPRPASAGGNVENEGPGGSPRPATAAAAGRRGQLPLGGCAHCGIDGRALKFCSRCQLVRFCNKDCQTAAWPEHKKVCKAPTVPSVIIVNGVNDAVTAASGASGASGASAGGAASGRSSSARAAAALEPAVAAPLATWLRTSAAGPDGVAAANVLAKAALRSGAVALAVASADGFGRAAEAALTFARPADNGLLATLALLSAVSLHEGTAARIASESSLLRKLLTGLLAAASAAEREPEVITSTMVEALIHLFDNLQGSSVALAAGGAMLDGLRETELAALLTQVTAPARGRQAVTKSAAVRFCGWALSTAPRALARAMRGTWAKALTKLLAVQPAGPAEQMAAHVLHFSVATAQRNRLPELIAVVRPLLKEVHAGFARGLDAPADSPAAAVGLDCAQMLSALVYEEGLLHVQALGVPTCCDAARKGGPYAVAAAEILGGICIHPGARLATIRLGGVAALAALLVPGNPAALRALGAASNLSQHADSRDALVACGAPARLRKLLANPAACGLTGPAAARSAIISIAALINLAYAGLLPADLLPKEAPLTARLAEMARGAAGPSAAPYAARALLSFAFFRRANLEALAASQALQAAFKAFASAGAMEPAAMILAPDLSRLCCDAKMLQYADPATDRLDGSLADCCRACELAAAAPGLIRQLAQVVGADPLAAAGAPSECPAYQAGRVLLMMQSSGGPALRAEVERHAPVAVLQLVQAGPGQSSWWAHAKLRIADREG